MQTNRKQITYETSAEIKDHITLEENNAADFYYDRGNAKYFLEDYKGAIDDCNKVIELDPNDPQAYIFPGDAKIALGDEYGTYLDLDKAGELLLAPAYN